MKYPIIKWCFCFLLVLAGTQVNAQEVAAEATTKIDSNELVLLIASLVFASVVLYALGHIYYALRVLRADFVKAGIYEKPVADSLTGMMPMEMEHEIMLAHDYDGIRELDNRLPPWWVYLFYSTLVFAVVYIWFYHIHGSGNIQDEEYRTELVEAEALQKLMANKVDENSVKLLTESDKLKEGEVIYMKNCVACHGKKGEGSVGPNLTDDYWMHGGDIKDIFKTVKYGVPAKGMISWQAQLGPGQIQMVSSYVKSLRGTNPLGGKEPQGEAYKE